MHTYAPAELRDGATLARECLAYGRPLPDLLAEQWQVARQRGDDCRLRGMLLIVLAVIDAMPQTDLPPELQACLSRDGRWQRIDGILAGGLERLQNLGRWVQDHYERRPVRFAGPLSIDSILQRRPDECRFKPMRWAKPKPGTSNWLVQR